MRPVFVDTSVLLLAVGGDHPKRDACRALLSAVGDRQARLHLSIEAGQEFLFHRLRRDDRETAMRKFDQLDSLAIWHPFDEEVLRAARHLMAGGNVRGRDAVHAATALSAGFSEIVSCDPDFDAIPGLRRIDPADWAS